MKRIGELSPVVARERPILVKRPMSDVPIFRRKNSDVWIRFRCLVVRSCFSRPGGWPHLMIVSRLPGRPTVAIWMRVGGANYIIARVWRWRGALAFEAGDGRMIISDLMDGRTQHSIHAGEAGDAVSRLVMDSLTACFRILSQQHSKSCSISCPPCSWRFQYEEWRFRSLTLPSAWAHSHCTSSEMWWSSGG